MKTEKTTSLLLAFQQELGGMTLEGFRELANMHIGRISYYRLERHLGYDGPLAHFTGLCWDPDTKKGTMYLGSEMDHEVLFSFVHEIFHVPHFLNDELCRHSEPYFSSCLENTINDAAFPFVSTHKDRIAAMLFGALKKIYAGALGKDAEWLFAEIEADILAQEIRNAERHPESDEEAREKKERQ